MGRDEHKKSRGKRHLAQTPKQQTSDGVDFEFSDEIVEKNYVRRDTEEKTKEKKVKDK